VRDDRAGASGVRLTAFARIVWGALLLAAPRATAERLGAELASPVERLVARLLGGRHVAQGIVTIRHPKSRWPALGSVVDVLHAGSMAALGAVDPGRAPVALRSAAIATGWAVVGGAAAARAGLRPGGTAQE